ncbi:NAD(P)H-dependent glycerol-3-phosphate dehydrogenase [Primorskyibacter marinus]|uniref:NAD(P)H-dependent glycerol-3-phosphate dehydrogenase n=1 Tax=Primorskyibacter marinus TaxID=1977320 RepID=UPI000E30867D|nr:NAD(P)H-dependent glycerol-3-phosphate dehydrogenase [Primorskyibacter marinus]
MTVGILGAGAFGTALAISIASGGTTVRLWGRSADDMAEQARQRRNARHLPDAAYPETLHPTADIAEALRCEVLLLAVPMQRLRQVLEGLDAATHLPLVACCKGIELSTGLGPVQLISALTPNPTAILTGPSFAQDIAKGLPTALTLACADQPVGTALQHKLSTPNIRLYYTSDTLGAELGGALKNVMAIACGAAIGAGLGDSARAALLTRGFAEMQRMAHQMGARPETLAGLSGLGDLALTCTSELSRNFRLGLTLGRGESFDTGVTVEGAATARATLEQANTHGIDMPITQTVVRLLDGTNLHKAMDDLLSRPLKEE